VSRGVAAAPAITRVPRFGSRDDHPMNKMRRDPLREDWAG